MCAGEEVLNTVLDACLETLEPLLVFFVALTLGQVMNRVPLVGRYGSVNLWGYSSGAIENCSRDAGFPVP